MKKRKGFVVILIILYILFWVVCIVLYAIHHRRNRHKQEAAVSYETIGLATPGVALRLRAAASSAHTDAGDRGARPVLSGAVTLPATTSLSSSATVSRSLPTTPAVLSATEAAALSESTTRSKSPADTSTNATTKT